MRKTLTIAAAILVAVAAPLSALALTIPLIIPDICVFTCITFTHSDTLLMLQQVENDITQAESLAGGFASRVGNPSAAIGAIVGVVNAANPLIQAHAAAVTQKTQQPTTAATIATADASASAAGGAHADAQAQSLYLSTIAQQSAQTNQLTAAQIEQKQAVEVSEVDQLKAATTGAADAGLAP